jgi:hypothetical protein
MMPTDIGNVYIVQRGSMPMDYVATRPGERNKLALPEHPSRMELEEAIRHDAYEKEQAEIRINRLATFLAARPEFSEADSLRLELAGRLASLDRFDEVKRQVQLLSKAGATPERGKALEAFRKYMTDKQGSNRDGSPSQ